MSAPQQVAALVQRSVRGRERRERRFRRGAAVAMAFGVGFLAWLLGTSVYEARGAWRQTHIALDIALEAEHFAARDAAAIEAAPYGGMVKAALRAAFPEVRERRDKRRLYRLVSDAAEYQVRDAVRDHPHWIGETRRLWVLASSGVDQSVKGGMGGGEGRTMAAPAADWVRALQADGRVALRFNIPFFTAGDSRNPEQAGILGALVGSLLTIAVTMLLALPVGVAAAIYLEEFAPRNGFITLVEVNINNLAAVPSIIFGLLGLAILLNFFGLPRSAPLVGGMALALMTLPTIILTSRAALAAVPARIRHAALAVGASEVQTVVHHTLPLALPGILSGAIIGLARALGETAPLLVIGMVAFIVDVPRRLTDPATVLPVQIYLWADSPERGFVERTSAAILVLLAVLVVINGAVAVLRSRREQQW